MNEETAMQIVVSHINSEKYNGRVKIAESTKRAGIDVYVDLNDMEDTYRRIDNAEAAAQYANKKHFGGSGE